MAFVDSNIWIAYLNKEDKFHRKSLDVLSRLKRMERIFVSSGIVYEVVNFLFKLKGKKVADGTLDFFLSSPQIEIVVPSDETWEKTVSIFKENELSLTDAQIVACMYEKKEKEIYSFDRHFDTIKSIERIS
ncbi:MAG: PIN domain-containing protein [Candidatus Diapherotrites archaeon]